MTYKNSYKTTPMATLADTAVEKVTLKEKKIEKNNVGKTLTTMQKWLMAGTFIAVLMPILVYIIGMCGVEVIANLFADGLFSINAVLTVVGSSIVGTLLTYVVYRHYHRDYELTSLTNPAWVFKYAKHTVLAYFAMSFLIEMFSGFVYVGDILTASIPGMFNTTVSQGDAMLVLTVLGVLVPVAYETFVGNVVQRTIVRHTNKTIGTLVHAVLTFVAFAMIGGNVMTGVIVSAIAAMSYTKYKHATYPASALVASNIMAIVFSVIEENIPVYVVAYIILTVLQKVVHYFVCKFQED